MWSRRQLFSSKKSSNFAFFPSMAGTLRASRHCYVCLLQSLRTMAFSLGEPRMCHASLNPCAFSSLAMCASSSSIDPSSWSPHHRDACLSHKAALLPEQIGIELLSWKVISTHGFATKGKKQTADAIASLSPDEKQAHEKEMALQSALSQITTTFGHETVMWMGRNVVSRCVPVISTGSIALDIALGIGGLPKGRVVEIYGPEASGKTTLALHVIAEAQKNGGYCVFIDAEHALDASLAEALGVRTENLLLAQPDCGEQALSLTDTFIRSGSIDVVVIDSVAALVPRVELEGEMGDSHMAVQARLMSQALRKLSHSLSRSQTILIFVNQTRSKLSSYGFGGGPIEVTSGGNALKFYASVRLNIRRTSLIKKGEETTGSMVSVKVAKNKLAPPFKTAEFEIEFGKGISKEGEIIDQSVKLGLLGKVGGWYSYNGQNLANGKDNLKKYLREHDDLQETLVTAIKQRLTGKNLEEDGVSFRTGIDDESADEHGNQDGREVTAEGDELEIGGRG